MSRLIETLWDGPSPAVHSTAGPAEALARLKLQPDVSGPEETQFVHRKDAGSDIYFVVNLTKRPIGWLKFRGMGQRIGERWHAEDGSVERLAETTAGADAVVALNLAQHGSAFVRFVTHTTAPKPVAACPIATIRGWTLTLPGRPAKRVTRGSRTEPAGGGAPTFSGVGSYRAILRLTSPVSPRRLLLDVGAVGDVAEVIVNDHPAGIAWTAPWRVDITRWARPGVNRVEIRVANLWLNHLRTQAHFGRAAGPIEPSGLFGPVHLFSQERGGADGLMSDCRNTILQDGADGGRRKRSQSF